MDTMSAYQRAVEARERGDRPRVFDWVRAAELIKERQPKVAAAGLGEDWEWTGGPIFRNGAPVDPDDTYTYLASLWAVPELDLDGEIIPCWVYMDESEFNQDSYWPAEALAVLGLPEDFFDN